MSLDQEIAVARKVIVSDGYDMSVGELMNLYRDGELRISPEYQRLFRWKPVQKSRFIESLLLGIPVPPIFVFQDETGRWELVDGLQRMSTIFEFTDTQPIPDEERVDAVVEQEDGQENEEEGADAETVSAEEDVDYDGEEDDGGPIREDGTTLSGTNFLPSLAEKRWEESAPRAGDGIGKLAQLHIKRARIRVEILKSESDVSAKFELFQRLNTGGSNLTEQEVRNCTAIMINPKFHKWLTVCSQSENFQITIAQTKEALRKQAGVELALRFFAFRNVPYAPGLDVHEYLDQALIKMAGNPRFRYAQEKRIFDATFLALRQAMEDQAFKRWDGENFGGKFLMSLFEVIAIGVSKNIDNISRKTPARQRTFLTGRAKSLWENDVFQANSGAGVRGTTRLMRLLPLAESHYSS
ncbi:UNVERIFIED_ORG: hypothetical protein ABIC54_003038 [Burkholderia sp. 1263]